MIRPPFEEGPLMRVCLFEDQTANLEPLSLTRPVFDLLCGQVTLATKQRRLFPSGSFGVLVRPHLAESYRLRHPETPVNDLSWLCAGPTFLLNGRKEKGAVAWSRV